MRAWCNWEGQKRRSEDSAGVNFHESVGRGGCAHTQKLHTDAGCVKLPLYHLSEAHSLTESSSQFDPLSEADDLLQPHQSKHNVSVMRADCNHSLI